MPERQYIINYTIDDSGFQAARARIEAGLRQMDAQAEQLKAKLGGLFTGTTRSMTTFERHLLDEVRLLGMLKTNVDSTAGSVTELGVSMQATNVHMKTGTTTAGGFGRAIGGIGVAVGAAQLVNQAMQAIAAGLENADTYATATAAKVAKVYDSLRELAALEGKAAPDAGTARGVVQSALATGMTVAEANEFETMWEGTIFAAKQQGNWGLDDAQTAEAKKQLGTFAVRNGLNPKTMGEWGAQIGISEKIESPTQLLGKMGMMQQMAAEGVGNVTPIYKVAQNLRGSMVRPGGGGAVRSAEELMGIISTGTLDVGNPAATTRAVEQAWRDLSSKPDVMKSLGIQTGDDFVTRIEKAQAYLDGTRAKGMDDQVAFGAIGMKNANANKKIVQFGQNLKILHDRTSRMGRGQTGADAAQVLEQSAAGVLSGNQKFLASDPGQARLSANANEAVDLARGAETLPAMSMLGSIEAEMKAKKEIGGEPSMADQFYGMSVMGVGVPGGAQGVRERRIIKKATERLFAAAAKAGVPGATDYDPNFVINKQGFADVYNRLRPEIEARGGTMPGADSVQAVQQAVGAMGQAPQVVPVPRPPQAAIAAPPAAKAGPNAHASIDASRLDAASDKLASVADALGAALRGRSAGRPGGGVTGGGLPESGGPSAPFRA